MLKFGLGIKCEDSALGRFLCRKNKKEKGPKNLYTVASGITPSGTVHIGNFREVISVDLVARALKDSGSQVRFIYSWDNYDDFAKFPKICQNKNFLKLI